MERRYNYGKYGNLQHYNQAYPPQYNLTALAVPTAIIYGSADKLADPADVLHTLQMIPTPVYVEEIAGYGHADFVWGLDAKDKLYPTVSSLLFRYRK
jgi:pimeloyl-ACP methyl ester carboxylesterase